MPDCFANERGEDKLRKRETAVRAQHAAAVRARKLSKTAVTGAIVLLSTGLVWVTWNNGKLAEKVAARDTVYAVLQPNGEWVSSAHYAEIAPTATQEQDIQNALWTYVQAYDCYGSSNVIRQYYILLAMSDQTVGRQVKAKFNLASPNAPQHVYGEKHITVQCDLIDPPAPIGDLTNHLYLFRFRRWEQNANVFDVPDPEKAPVYTVTVGFRTGVYPEDDKRRAWLDRTTFNAPGVQVIEYPGAKPSNIVASSKVKG